MHRIKFDGHCAFALLKGYSVYSLDYIRSCFILEICSVIHLSEHSCWHLILYNVLQLLMSKVFMLAVFTMKRICAGSLLLYEVCLVGTLYEGYSHRIETLFIYSVFTFKGRILCLSYCLKNCVQYFRSQQLFWQEDGMVLFVVFLWFKPPTSKYQSPSTALAAALESSIRYHIACTNVCIN